MPKAKVYNVKAMKPSGWAVIAVGAKAPSARFERKPLAVARAKQMAAKAGTAKVVVYKKDGTKERDYKFAPPKPKPKAKPKAKPAPKKAAAKKPVRKRTAKKVAKPVAKKKPVRRKK